MSKMSAKWLMTNAEMFEVTAGGNLDLLVAGAGGLEKTATGVGIAAGGVTESMLASSYLLVDGTKAMTGDLNMGSQKIINVATPTADTDGATKAYVDDRVNGIDRKASVRAATTEDISLTGAQTIDGVALNDGDRVLVKDQTDGTQNGIYVANSSGAWLRAEDADGTPDNEVTSGMFTFVEEGTAAGSTGWSLVTTGTITLDTTSLTFSQTSEAGELSADGLGIVKVGNEFQLVLGDGFDKSSGTVQLVLDGTSLSISASGLKVADDGITETQIAASAFGNGIGGGSGSTIALAALTTAWDLGGVATITNVPMPVNATDVASKAYVDQEVSNANNRMVDLFTLDASAITAGYVDLSTAPDAVSRVTMTVKGGPGQHNGDDFQVIDNGSGAILRLSWSGLGLDGVLEAGDKITVTYDV